MNYRGTSYELVGQMLSRDIYSETGAFLLSKGTRLKASDIALLVHHGIYEVAIEQTVSIDIVKQTKGIWGKKDKAIQEKYVKNLEKIKHLFSESGKGKIHPLEDFMQGFAPLLKQTLEHSYLFYPIYKIKGFDDYTYRHSVNVGLLSSIIGKLLGLQNQDVLLLGEMGLLHDIGKSKISESILNKPGKLTSEEFAEMKRHTNYGFQILQGMKGTYDLIYQAALSHHEKLDGSGYPDGLKDREIPFLVQIITVADTYDAICSDRVYQGKSSPFFAAKELMEEAFRGRLNTSIVIPFVRYIVQVYVGASATLSDGQEGTVVYINSEEPHRPILRSNDGFIDLKQRRDLSIVSLNL